MKYLSLLLVITSLISCQTPNQKAYQELLDSGVHLIDGSIIEVKVGDKVLYPYSFSAGVEPIHYTLKCINSDTNLLRYLGKDEYYLDSENVAGGRSGGVHLFEAKAPGEAIITFYNPYYNKERYESEAEANQMSEEELIKSFYMSFAKQSFDSIPSTQNKEELHNWKVHLNDTSLNLGSVMKAHAKLYAFLPDNLEVIIDSLYDSEEMLDVNNWFDVKDDYLLNLPIHPEEPKGVCTVKIIPK